MSQPAVTLAEAIQDEIKRVRDDVLPAYLEIGTPGAFGVAMMRRSIDAATKALAEGNAVACMLAYKDLREYEPASSHPWGWGVITAHCPIVAYCTGCGQGYITRGSASGPVCWCGSEIQNLKKPIPRNEWAPPRPAMPTTHREGGRG